MVLEGWFSDIFNPPLIELQSMLEKFLCKKPYFQQFDPQT